MLTLQHSPNAVALTSLVESSSRAPQSPAHLETTIESYLAEQAAQDERIPLLIQLPGVGVDTAIAILAGIGTIDRFPSADELVGYAGMGTRVHDSGQTHRTGRITKAGRRDLRSAMVEVANIAVRHHPDWRAELARLEPRLGRSKAILAIARKLLVAVWHVLAEETVDRNALPEQVVCSFFAHAYKVGVRNLPDGQSAKQFTRAQLDRLGIGQEMKMIRFLMLHLTNQNRAGELLISLETLFYVSESGREGRQWRLPTPRRSSLMPVLVLSILADTIRK